MDSYRETHSVNMATIIGGVLVVGTALAYLLTWISNNSDAYGAQRASLGDVMKALDLMDRSWVADVARLGVVAALVAALALPRTYWFTQQVCISLGGAAALFLPIYVYRKFGDGDHMGAGLIIFALAAVITIIAPWVVRDEADAKGSIQYVDHDYHPRQTREKEPPAYLR